MYPRSTKMKHKRTPMAQQQTSAATTPLDQGLPLHTHDELPANPLSPLSVSLSEDPTPASRGRRFLSLGSSRTYADLDQSGDSSVMSASGGRHVVGARLASEPSANSNLTSASSASASSPQPPSSSTPLTFRGVRSLKHHHDKSFSTDGLRKSNSLQDLSTDDDLVSPKPQTFFEFLVNEPPKPPPSKNSRYLRLAGIPSSRSIEDYSPDAPSAPAKPRHVRRKSMPTTDLEHMEASRIVASTAKFWESKSSNNTNKNTTDRTLSQPSPAHSASPALNLIKKRHPLHRPTTPQSNNSSRLRAAANAAAATGTAATHLPPNKTSPASLSRSRTSLNRSPVSLSRSPTSPNRSPASTNRSPVMKKTRSKSAVSLNQDSKPTELKAESRSSTPDAVWPPNSRTNNETDERKMANCDRAGSLGGGESPLAGSPQRYVTPTDTSQGTRVPATAQITPGTRVCAAHFPPADLTKTLTGRARLRPGAVPSIFDWTKAPTKRRKLNRTSTVTSEENLPDVDALHADPETETSETMEVVPVSADHDYSEPPASMEDQLTAARAEIERLEQQVQQVKAKTFFLERFAANPQDIMFYTGFKNYKTLVAVFNALKPTAASLVRWAQMQRHSSNPGNIRVGAFQVTSLQLIDQFFLFLCRVKQGFPERDLCMRFGVSQTSVSRILITWANYLYCMLGSLEVWPSRDIVDRNMPECFRKTYPRTRVILDCTELKVQTPSSKVLNSESYSSYKSHSTFKSLIGITPCGSVSFVSSLYTGCISDKDITTRSGILDLLEQDDEVMADKGFLIQDLLVSKGATLVIPPFLGPKGKFSAQEVSQTHQIARLRIHVERAIRRIKEYHIFDGVIPLSLAPSINQLWTVCSLLTNFRGPLF